MASALTMTEPIVGFVFPRQPRRRQGGSCELFSYLQLGGPTEFTKSSPHILPGPLSSLKKVLGPNAKSTLIQSLSLKWLLN
jgi:hypothetical protein